MSNRLKNPYLEAAVIGAVTAVGVVGGITIKAHREDSHESLFLDSRAQALANVALWLSGTVPAVWADVHTGPHHQMRDANIASILETGDYLKWREDNPDVESPPIPEQFSNLDPVADLSTDDIKVLSALAREIQTRKGPIKDLYITPGGYSREEAIRLLDTEKPRYQYEAKPSKDIPKKLSFDSVSHLLRDPTSPALHKNGFFGVLLGGIGLYRRAAQVFARERDATNDYDLSTWSKRLNVNYRKWGPGFLFAANIGARIGLEAANGNLNKKTAKTAIATGTASALITSGTLLAGSNIVNSAGHINVKKVTSFLGKRDLIGAKNELLKPSAKEADGTFTNDADGVGLGLFTQDEAARQDQHHKWPWRVAFTNKTGFLKIREAPYGSALDFLAKHRLAGLRTGKQFGEKSNPEGYDKSKRPDMPAEAVLLLEAFRVRTMTKNS